MGQLQLASSGGKPSAPFQGAKAIPRPLGVVFYFFRGGLCSFKLIIEGVIPNSFEYGYS